jgi:hypothetical protein
MALPLLLLGASALVLLASNETSIEKENRTRIKAMPGEGKERVKPVDGAIVSCGVFGLFDHTGIWLDDSVVELKGNGLIRGVSPRRFLQNRSGEQIFIACDQHNQPLVSEMAATRASQRLFEYSEYDLFKNNCHKFVWQCISGKQTQFSRFSEFNRLLAQQFDCEINWQVADVVG